MYQSLPKAEGVSVIGRQILRSGTSVGANYRAVCRARSDKDFISKLGIVIEEADETAFWMELLIEAEFVSAAKLAPLLQETNELLAIFGATQRTMKARLAKSSTNS